MRDDTAPLGCDIDRGTGSSCQHSLLSHVAARFLYCGSVFLSCAAYREAPAISSALVAFFERMVEANLLLVVCVI
jgi:hypothetical protein